ncbi:nucleoporin-like protein 2 [Spodoptera litura]|uniref:Nucleoporin NUP42 n=1 Tax=Spodoptera litura TaxID=69820 RepID=A0A9J7E8Q9_SPOLT|nr:nucleoporin-like protein 2 [Spodoptera litura]
MVVCKFFQAGYCKFGKNCRFEHVYGSKYSYHANPQTQPVQQAPVQTLPGGITDEQLVKQVQADVQAVLKGGQWILSCYSPIKEKPIFPGIHDLSPEEIRLFIYEGKNTNNVEQAVAYINNVVKETRQKYEQLLQPNMNIIKVLRSLYKGEQVSSPFATQPENVFSTSNSAAASIFRSAVQSGPVINQNVNNAQSIFSQAQSSIFNQQAQDPAKQLFAQATQHSFGPSQPVSNIFAPQNQNADPKSIFGVAAQNINQTTANPSNIFGAANQSIFGRAPTDNPSPFNQGNVFQPAQNPASIFGQVQNKSVAGGDPNLYSKMEDVDEVDLEAFKSDNFQLGFIPELPPPYELCTGQSKPQLFS